MQNKKSLKRKVREGVVIANKMQKTVTVKVERSLRHPHLQKIVLRSKKYYAHADDNKQVAVGTKVRIMETRPLSKLKRWKVMEVIA